MKLCFICSEYPPGPHGGIGTVVQIVARELVREQHEVRVIGVYSEDYPAKDYEDDCGVKVWRLREKPGKYSWIPVWYKQYKIIKNWIRKKEIDIVEAPESRGWYAFWPKLSVPLVLRAHGLETQVSEFLGNKPNKLTKWLERLSYKRADAYSSVSKYSAAVAKKMFNLKKEHVVIYNGIELIELDPSVSRVKNKIVFSGTLTEKKGVIQLIEAAKLLFRNCPDFILEINGKDSTDKIHGSMKDYLMTLIPPELESKIIFRGHVGREELFRSYMSASVAVFPSFWETFGVAPIEAMMCGCPTIHSTIATGYEIIENNVDGILVDPHNSKEISEAINSVLINQDLANQLSIKGRQKVERLFSKEAMIKELTAFYQKEISMFELMKHH